MRDLSLIVAAAILLTGCVSARAHEESRRFAQLTVQVDKQASGIDISSYTLITDNAKRDRRDATEIMRVKADWPRAMQTKSKDLFESILALDFTFRAEDEWFERDAYIRDRVESVETVDSARYENLVLQFFGEVAVLTYRNVVSGIDGLTGLPETWHYSWADVYVREDGKWKIGGSHQISGHSETSR
jgi:hypothetical protein